MDGQRNRRESTMTWTNQKEIAFIQICYDYVKEGKLQRSTFKEECWGMISEDLKRIINEDCDIARLKGKWNRLRSLHRSFSELIKNTGVTWDSNTCTVSASEEVWQAFYAKNAKIYKKFKKDGCPHYKMLGELFGGTTTTRVGTLSTHLPPTSDEEQQIEGAFLTKGVHVRVQNIEKDEIEKPTRRRKTLKMSKSEKLEASLARWESSMTKRDDESELRQAYLKEKLTKIQGKSSLGTSESEATSKDPYSLVICMTILNNIEELTDEIYAKAIKALKDPEFRVQFVLMLESRRKAVLEFL